MLPVSITPDGKNVTIAIGEEKKTYVISDLLEKPFQSRC